MGVGLLTGAIVTGSISKKVQNKLLIGSVSSVFLGISIIVFPFLSHLLPAILISIIIGVCIVIIQIISQTSFQDVPVNVRGRIVGVSQMVNGATMFLSMGLSGFLAEKFGLTIVLCINGILAILIGGILFLWKKFIQKLFLNMKKA
jgi:MFS family permease